MSQATYHDAELILKLYDLRRESKMREAREFFAKFNPASFEELMGVMGNFESKESAYLRQVLSYWEMAAALVVHGTLNAELAQDTLGEMTFVYAKMKPFIKQMREMMKAPEMFQSVEKVMEGSADARDRLARTEQRIAEFMKMRAASAKVA